MSDFTTINGLQVLSSTPIGDAGQALNNNFLTIGTSLSNLSNQISALSYMNYRGTWGSGNSYKPNDVVSLTSSFNYGLGLSAYVNLTATGGTNTDPVNNPSDWFRIGSPFNFTGNWHSSVHYIPGDAVLDSGGLYVCLQACNGYTYEPSNNPTISSNPVWFYICTSAPCLQLNGGSTMNANLNMGGNNIFNGTISGYLALSGGTLTGPLQGSVTIAGIATMGGPGNPSVTLACDHYGNMVATCSGVPNPGLSGFGSVSCAGSLAAALNTLDDGQGNCTLAGGAAFGGNSSSAQALSTSGGTITNYNVGLWYGTVRLNPTGNCTGTILPISNGHSSPPAYGQQLTIINESAFTITFAASGTSHVADGTSDVIAATKAAIFVWDSGTTLWYRVG